MLEKDEIKAAAGSESRLIDVEQFVCADDIEPVLYDKTYYLGTQDDGKDAYRLLHDALEKAGRAGIGRWVFHNREYLVAIRSIGPVLAMHTMRFHDELVDPKELDIPSPQRKPTEREIKMAGTLIDTLHTDFDPEMLTDSYRDHVLDYLDKKRKGKAPKPKKAKPPEASDDLLAALEASLKAS